MKRVLSFRCLLLVRQVRVAPGAGPRLTNTFINGTALGLFEEVVEPLARSVAWLRFVLQLIHTELVRAFSRWAQQNPSSRLPRISLLCALQASVFQLKPKGTSDVGTRCATGKTRSFQSR